MGEIEEYINIAESIIGKISRCDKRKDAFIFYNEDMKQDGCVVITKHEKKIITMPQYIFKNKQQETI